MGGGKEGDGGRLPGGLAEVGTLAGYLEEEPLLQVVFFGEGGVCQVA